jgi:hypothetical protein
MARQELTRADVVEAVLLVIGVLASVVALALTLASRI